MKTEDLFFRFYTEALCIIRFSLNRNICLFCSAFLLEK